MSSLFLPEIEVKSFHGLTIASKNVTESQQAWAFEAFEYLREIRLRLDQIESRMNDPQLLSLTRKKMKTLKDIHTFHLNNMSSLMSFLSDPRIQHSEYSRIMGQKPQTNHLSQYHSHLCKDWSWGNEEISSAKKLIASCLKEINGAGGKMLALGAGACRLPYELHRHLPFQESYMMDINPLLLSIARKVIQGEKIEIVEFPLVPLNSESFAVSSVLQCEQKIDEGIHYLVHDVQEWGFQNQTFDFVFTPWFIDISPLDAVEQFARINSVLKKGSYWINYGPLIFNKSDFSKYYSLEEVIYLVEKSGFEILSHSYEAVPHLKNPQSGRWQHDHVLTFCAQKVKDCATPDLKNSTEAPDWIDNHQLKIDLPQTLTELQLGLGFTLDLAMNCQKGLSIAQLAQVMSQRHQMPVEKAEYLITSTLRLWMKQSGNI